MTRSSSSSVHVAFDGCVAMVALDDPARRNALSAGMFDALEGGLDQVSRRDDVPVAGDEQRGTADARGVGRLRVGERLAAARVAVGALPHQRLAHEGDRDGPLCLAFARQA